MGDVSCTRGRVLLVETQVQTAEQSGRCDSWSTVRPPAPQMFRVVILHIGQVGVFLQGDFTIWR